MPVSKSFSALGIPFPLFEAPSDQASEYGGVATCSLCGSARQHCFRLAIGCGLMIECPGCGSTNGLDADDREDIACRQCQSVVPFPRIDDEEICACYRCLRSGMAAITHNTELGMIAWEQALDGVSHGLPGLDRDDFEMVAKEDGWVGARLPQDVMFELLRTPTYQSLQGEVWQFCCSRPMIFVGTWSRADFSRHSPDGDGRRYFQQVVRDCVPGLWEDQLHDVTGVYVFRCPFCGGRRAHWDVA
jgi:uncharacterized protein CbrC (UPF0167 family)